MKFKPLILLVTLFFFTSIQAINRKNTSQQERKLNIIVTVPYLQDLIENITCHSQQYKVSSLIPVGVDPHTFILAPDDRIRLKNADLIVQIGAGLEPWLDKIPLSQNNLIVLSKHLMFRKMDEDKGNSKSEFVYDPHIWQSPKLTEDAVLALAQILIEINSMDKVAINSCTRDYTSKIETTVVQLKKQIEKIPERERVIATNHDSLGYFAETFGFKIYSILGLSDEEEPSLVELTNLIMLLKQQHIKSIFLESTGNNKNIQTVSVNAHVNIGGKLYGDSFGEKGSGADTTLGMWQTNVSRIVKALQ